MAADALGGPAGYDRLGPVLETLERHDAPLLIHPGPVAAPPPSAPRWWAALTDYVVRRCRRRGTRSPSGAGPRTRGCASASRCSPASRRCTASGCWRAAATAPRDPGVFLDVSSYGERAIDAVLREIGVDQLVYGSDRPVVAPHDLPLGDAVLAALRERNPSRLLGAKTMEMAV